MQPVRLAVAAVMAAVVPGQATGAPAAAIALALASACSSGNSESRWPWMSSVGALICPATATELDLASNARASGVALPVLAISW